MLYPGGWIYRHNGIYAGIDADADTCTGACLDSYALILKP